MPHLTGRARNAHAANTFASVILAAAPNLIGAHVRRACPSHPLLDFDKIIQQINRIVGDLMIGTGAIAQSA
jgi:hypothetical protein